MADQKIEMVGCDTHIDGEKVTLEYDINGHWSGPNPWLHDDGQMTFREAFLVMAQGRLSICDYAPKACPRIYSR